MLYEENPGLMGFVDYPDDHGMFNPTYSQAYSRTIDTYLGSPESAGGGYTCARC
jgi:hypothetical protein